MKAKILIRKKIKAPNIESALKIIKQKYPRAKVISYRNDVNMWTLEKKDRNYNERTITVAFVDDIERCWE
jgi:hypothetical protein